MIKPARTVRSISAALVVSLGFCATLPAQGTRSDYERASSLRRRTENKVFKTRVAPHWFAGNARFWYRNDLAGGEREFVLVDAVQGTRQPAFDHARLAASLAKAAGKPIDAKRLPIDGLDFSDKEPVVLLRSEGKLWRCDLRSYELRQEKADDKPAATSSLPVLETPKASR